MLRAQNPQRGYSLLTQPQVLISMLFMSSQIQQEYREHLRSSAAALSFSDLEILPL